jgi:hypothetical protein
MDDGIASLFLERCFRGGAWPYLQHPVDQSRHLYGLANKESF